MFLERRLVSTSLRGMLTIDKRVVLFAILVGMGKSDFEVFVLDADDGVEALDGHVVGQQVFQSVSTAYASAVIHDGKPRTQVGVVAEHGLDDIIVVRVVLEEGVVGLEVDISTVFVLSLFGGVALEDAALKDQTAHESVAIGAYLEAAAQCVHRLGTYAVEAHALLEGFGVILAAGVEHAHCLYEFALGDAAAIVAHAHTQIVHDIDLDAVARLHLELVYRVVYDFFEQYIDAVFGKIAVAQTTDIHTGTRAHVLHVREMAYIVVGIVDGGFGLSVHDGQCLFFVFFHHSIVLR